MGSKELNRRVKEATLQRIARYYERDNLRALRHLAGTLASKVERLENELAKLRGKP